MTATPDDIRDDAADKAATGVSRRRINDREVQYLNPKDQIEAAALLAAQTSTHGPFFKVGLSKRSI